MSKSKKKTSSKKPRSAATRSTDGVQRKVLEDQLYNTEYDLELANDQISAQNEHIEDLKAEVETLSRELTTENELVAALHGDLADAYRALGALSKCLPTKISVGDDEIDVTGDETDPVDEEGYY